MAGRKRKFDTVEEMQQAIDNYFRLQDAEKKPYTVQGLCRILGFSTRQSLINYEGYNDINDKPFLDTLKSAKLRVEENKIEGAMMGKFNAASIIFDLKNNHGHSDKQEIVTKDETDNIDLSKLTDEELRAYLQLAAKCKTDTSGTSEA